MGDTCMGFSGAAGRAEEREERELLGSVLEEEEVWCWMCREAMATLDFTELVGEGRPWLSMNW